jgi:adenylyl-sulfate kinase
MVEGSNGDMPRVGGSKALNDVDVRWQQLEVTRAARAALLGSAPCVLWFTGLSGAGKSTIANLVEKQLHALGKPTYLLDGDNVRHGLNRDLGFTDADRAENVRRVAEVARLMADAGLIVLVSLISPFRAERRMARELMKPGEFIEIFVDTPLEVAEARDPKGLYKKARRGELKNFTAIDSPYEVPERAEIRVETAHCDPAASALQVLAALQQTWQNGAAQTAVAAPKVVAADEFAGSPIVAAAMAAKQAASSHDAKASDIGSPITAAAMAAKAKHAAASESTFADSPIVAAAMAAKKAAASNANTPAAAGSGSGSGAEYADSPIVAAAMAAKKAAVGNAAVNPTATQQLATQPVTTALTARNRTIYSFVVDAEPRFAHEGYHLARSLIQHCSDQPADIHVQFTREVDAHTRERFRALGCTLHDVERFGDGRDCNKIAQLTNLHRIDFDHVVLLDTDMIAVADIRPFLGVEALVAKVVDVAQPPLPVLEEIARAAGLRNLPPVGTADIEYVATFAGHSHAGFYGIPKALAEIVDRSWRYWAQWLSEHDEPLKRSGALQHIDQVSMWLAIVMDRIPYRAAPSNVNYYVHTDSEHRYLDTGAGIALIRYDDAKLDALGKLKPLAQHNALERHAIEVANRQIGEGVENAEVRNVRVAQP